MTLSLVDRNSSPNLDELVHPEDGVVDGHTGSQSDLATEVTSTGRSLPERFLSFVKLLKRPRLTTEQKRLFDGPLDDLVADARHEIHTRDAHDEDADLAVIRPPSSYGPPVATANAFLDENRPWRPRPPSRPRDTRRTLWLLGASVSAALAWATLLLSPGPGPAPEPTEVRPAPAPVEARSYPIDQTADINDLTVVFGDLIELADRYQLNIYTINFAEKARPGGIIADDGQGNQVKVVDESETLPPRSVKRRVIDIPAGFDAWSPGLRLREEPPSVKGQRILR